MLGSVSARACDGADCITVVVLNMSGKHSMISNQKKHELRVSILTVQMLEVMRKLKQSTENCTKMPTET